MTNIILESTITCPYCLHYEREIMPSDLCQYFYDCKIAWLCLSQNPEIAALFVPMAPLNVHLSKRTFNVVHKELV